MKVKCDYCGHEMNHTESNHPEENMCDDCKFADDLDNMKKFAPYRMLKDLKNV